MARQKIEDNLFYFIFRQVPTWVTITSVAASYPVLRWLLPFLTHGNAWAQAGSFFAPWLTSFLALFAVAAEADKYKRRRLFTQQSSLDTLRRMSWLEFEHLVGEAYRQQGYTVEEQGGSGPDGGVDIILRRSGETVLVQCKHWKTQQVGVAPVRQLRGVVANAKATRGIFVTSNGYTTAALSEAGGHPLLELIDGPNLLMLIQEVQAKDVLLAPAMSNAQAVDKARTVNEMTEPLCPNCGSVMKRKTARQGPNAGSDFWGCSEYPRCRGTGAL